MFWLTEFWKIKIVNLSLFLFWFVLFVPYLRSLSALRSQRCSPGWAAGRFQGCFSHPSSLFHLNLNSRMCGDPVPFFLYNLSVVPFPFSESPFFPLWFECSPVTCQILTYVLVYFQPLVFFLCLFKLSFEVYKSAKPSELCLATAVSLGPRTVWDR